MDGLCSGTVVAPNVVLTAAHCVIDDTTGATLPSHDFGVVTGTLNWAEAPGRQLSSATQVLVAPGFNDGTGENDAALLILATPTTAPALPLASGANAELWSPGSDVVFAGWGQTDQAAADSTANLLQWASTIVQPSNYCSGASLSPFNAETQLCTVDAPHYDTSVCAGDSGGPLIADELQGQPGTPMEIGIVRSSTGNCDPAGIDIFTRVDGIAGWAEGAIAAAAHYPPNAVPPPPLPLSVFAMTGLDVGTAKTLVRTTLSWRFGARFIRRVGYASDCRRQSQYRVSCGVAWSHGVNDYWGLVSISYGIADASFVWSGRYSISWANGGCYFHSGHPARCRIFRTSGSY